MYTDRFGEVMIGDEFVFKSSGRKLKILALDYKNGTKFADYLYEGVSYRRSNIETWVDELIMITNKEKTVKRILAKIDEQEGN